MSIEPDPNGGSRIEAEFNRLCSREYIGINWFRTWPNGMFDPAPVTLLRKPGDISSPNRPLGTQRSEPWIFGIRPDEFRTASFARLSHRCHPFCTTTTDFHELPRPHLGAR